MSHPSEQSQPPADELRKRLQARMSPQSHKVLIAEDDPIGVRIIEAALSKFGYDPIVARSGSEAWEKFDRDPVRLVVSDWMMPGMDGLEFCAKVRARLETSYTYFILLTANGTSAENHELASAAGVDDFLTKPLDRGLIGTRLRVAERILRYTAEIRQLQEMIPICAYCHKVRDEHNYWDRVEHYIQKQTGSRFTHAACPQCYDREAAQLKETLLTAR